MIVLEKNDLEKLARYIDGQADDIEKAWVESLFINGEEDYTFRSLLEKDWNLMSDDSSATEVDLSHLLDKVHHTIRKNEQLKKERLLHRFTRVYMKVAAILIFPLLIAGGLGYYFLGNMIQNTKDQLSNFKIYAPMGARVSFHLPDGTVGMLNSGSCLSYSLPFNNNRHIVLAGEAWFEVNHDIKHPFEITTGTSTIKVLGTKFNICAYPADHFVEVVLKEGKVEYINKELSRKATLSPSERLVFQNGQISRSVIDPAKYSAWVNGELIFKGDPMIEVARRIEYWYNIKVELHDKELEKYSFRATFKDDRLEEVLRFLCMTSPIRYHITPRKLLPNGTYEKEKVTIYLKQFNSKLTKP
ncbi:MAG: DUF4974 domain-containing protein [Bacteroidetes bacterium]|nr:DUF4974 domain-containing protein [Bacteroidota bacterium]